MKRNKKPLLIGALAVLLAVLVVGGTVAWLTAANSVTNTFTVGQITQPDPNKPDKPDPSLPDPDEGDASLEGNIYEVFDQGSKIYPGATVKKMPYVGIGAKSEDSYVFVYVDNQLVDEIDKDQGGTSHTPYFTLADGWAPVDDFAVKYNGEGLTENTYCAGLFMMSEDGTNPSILEGNENEARWTGKVFESVTVPDGAVAEEFAENPTMEVWCYLYAAVDEAASDNGATALQAAKTWSNSPEIIFGTATTTEP